MYHYINCYRYLRVTWVKSESVISYLTLQKMKQSNEKTNLIEYDSLFVCSTKDNNLKDFNIEVELQQT